MKQCRKCERWLENKDFHKDRRQPDGHKIYCKNCACAAARIYYQTSHAKQKHKIAARNWRRKNPCKMLLQLAKQRAKRLGLEFDLIEADIVIPDKCPVLGIKLITGSRQLKDYSPTLDRINPVGGYTVDNVRVISWRANRLKSDATLDELKRVLDYMECCL